MALDQSPHQESNQERRARLRRERSLPNRLRKGVKKVTSAAKDLVEEGRFVLHDTRTKMTAALTHGQQTEEQRANHLILEGIDPTLPVEDQVYRMDEIGAIRLEAPKNVPKVLPPLLVLERLPAPEVPLQKVRSLFRSRLLAVGAAAVVTGIGALSVLPQVREGSDQTMRQQLVARESAWESLTAELGRDFFQLSMGQKFRDLVRVERDSATGAYTFEVQDPRFILAGEYALADRGTSGFSPLAYEEGPRVRMDAPSQTLWPYHALWLRNKQTGQLVEGGYFHIFSNTK